VPFALAHRMSVGAELAAARQGLGLSVGEVAAKTNITSERLRAIEQMGGVWLPSRVHLPGFVRVYAAAVQLDPDAIAQRYVAELDVSALSYTASTSGAAVRGPVDDSALDEFSSESGADNDDLRAIESAPVSMADDRVNRPWDARPIREPELAQIPQPDIAPIREPDVQPVNEPDIAPPSEPDIPLINDHGVAPLADHDIAPLDEHDIRSIDDHGAPPASHTVPSVSSPSPVRYVAVVIVAALGVSAGWLLSSNLDTITTGLTQASASERDAEREKATAANDARHANAPEQVAPAVPAVSDPPASSTGLTPNINVPTDTGRRANVEPDAGRAAAATPENARSGAPAAAPANEPTAAVSAPVTAPLPNTGARTNASATALPTEPQGARAVAPAPTEADRTTDRERAGEARNREAANNGDLSGWWAVTNRVESASVDAFENLNLGFHLQLQQRGNRVTGTGEKWMENGRRIPAGSRTRIAVEGTLIGDRLELNFTEHGTRRTSNGTFVMNVADDGTLRGTFASDAANAQGTSLARRIESPPR
jgi:hypothetical protein